MKRSPRFSLLLMASVLGAVLSCSTDQIPTGPVAQASVSSPLSSGLVEPDLWRGLLYCRPLPYASTTQTIGPSGGTISVGPHTLTIPAGALSRSVAITAEAPSDSVNSVQLLPQGLTFAAGKPARLTLSYSNCSLLGILLPKRIAYTTDSLTLIQLLPSIDDLLRRRVSASLKHFSRYAVSW